MDKIKLLGFILTIPLGAVMFIYAGIDDSPGGQMIGLVIAAIGIAGLIKKWLERKKSQNMINKT